MLKGKDMKKQYTKPQTQVILLQQHSQLLAGSTMQMYNDGDDVINDGSEVW